MLLTSATCAQAPFAIILGVAQDAGYPQAGCRKDCCRRAWDDPSARRRAVALAIVDPESRERWLVECTPGVVEQLHTLDAIAPPMDDGPYLDGVLLTHAHIGHYAGLVHLGREVMGTRGVPVLAMPRMREFLEGNGPWSQLVSLENIRLVGLYPGRATRLNDRLSVRPIPVPHRDEFSETVAFRIAGPSRSVLFLPDIDKWEQWDVWQAGATRVEDVLATVDRAYLDGTFYDAGELPGRDMSEIPHPFVVESLDRFAKLPAEERAKVRFLHLNHTNPLLNPASDKANRVSAAGMDVAEEGERFEL